MPTSWLLLIALGLPQAEGDGSLADLTELSLEELLDVEITSVSRKAERLTDAPAAVYVITQEEIRRSGHTSIPELLRLAPGMHVARINSNAWAIGARGFSGRFTDKLLVMIDGRTVYNNLFSGVWWDAQDLVLEDIERIEIVRGPGGSVWGANAVNGVVNIITKPAADTVGTFASGLVGTEEGILQLRHGQRVGDEGHLRAYAKWFARDDSADLDDDWRYVRGGFRTDLAWSERDTFTLQADLYHGSLHEEVPLLSPNPPFDATIDGTTETDGGNVLGRWTRLLEDDSDLSLQIYYDVAQRDFDGQISDHRNTLDVDFKHRFTAGSRHELVWGLGWRYIDSTFEGSEAVSVQPENRDDVLVSGFLQDEITLVEDVLSLVLGTKLEHNDYSGFEVQPTARTTWTPAEHQTLWASVSRAVRSPSEVDHDIVLPIDVAPGPVVTIAFGDEDFDSEELLAYEVGYRTQPREDVSLDVAAFWFEYDGIVTLRPGTPMGGVQPVFFDNGRKAEVYGLEAAFWYDATEDWRLQGSVSVARTDSEEKPGNEDVSEVEVGETYPEYQAQLHSYHDLSDDVELDLALYAVDELPAFGVSGYVRGDARLSWRPTASLEVSVVLQNAFEAEHEEFGSELVSKGSAIERAAYVQLSWRP